MSSSPETLDTIRRRLGWRASRRGIKEMDILVGGFAALNLLRMGAEELAAFEAILDIPDQTLLAWFTDQESCPLRTTNPMLEALLRFRPAEDV
jgi:antitoxin CptB